MKKKKPVISGNQKAALHLAKLLENKQFLRDRDHAKELSGIYRARAVKKLLEDYHLTDTMLDEVFREFPTLGSEMKSNDLFRITDNSSGSVGFPVKIEISSLAARDGAVAFIKENWPQIEKDLLKGRKKPIIKSPELGENYEIDFWIYWMKKQGATTSMVRTFIKKEYSDLDIRPEEVTARYNNELKRRNKKIAASG